MLPRVNNVIIQLLASHGQGGVKANFRSFRLPALRRVNPKRREIKDHGKGEEENSIPETRADDDYIKPRPPRVRKHSLSVQDARG